MWVIYVGNLQMNGMKNKCSNFQKNMEILKFTDISKS